MLGELTAILGIVDDEMTKLVGTLLNVNRLTANTIMGSSKIADNSEIWAKVIAARHSDPDTLWLVKHAQNEIQGVSAGRNDFIHAVYSLRKVMTGGLGLGLGLGLGFGRSISVGPVMARRVKADKAKSIEELPSIRDRAARLSCLVSHISHLVAGNPPENSPWHERLAPTLPPRPDTDAARTAKARRRPRGSSQG